MFCSVTDRMINDISMKSHGRQPKRKIVEELTKVKTSKSSGKRLLGEISVSGKTILGCMLKNMF